MSEKQIIRIFFSWQSDLPYQKTTRIIEKALNNLKILYSGSVEIVIDRDMRNTLGMLDIGGEILTKIENADIFVADLSIVTNYHKLDKGKDKQKSLSNPNVLFELGYAASIVTWSCVAAVANIDFGDIENQPFDINHRSILKFSLKKDSDDKVIESIQNYLNRYIVDIIQNGKRAKKDSTFYEIGSFDFSSNLFVKEIRPYEANEMMDSYLGNLREDINNTIEIIKSIKIVRYDKVVLPELDKQMAERNNRLKSILSDYPFRNIISEAVSVVISDEIKLRIKEFCIENKIDINENDFFFLGGLKTKTQVHIADISPSFEGSDKEIEKYNVIDKLYTQIIYYNYIKSFFELFDGVKFLSIAIKNSSDLSDERISVVLKFEGVELVSLSESLPDAKKESFEMAFTDDKLMESIFKIHSNAYIFDNYGNWPALFSHLDIYSKTQKYFADDISKIIDWYFAKPTDNAFSFYINSLNSNDICWVGPLILLKGDLNECIVRFTIRGKNMKSQQVYEKRICVAKNR